MPGTTITIPIPNPIPASAAAADQAAANTNPTEGTPTMASANTNVPNLGDLNTVLNTAAASMIQAQQAGAIAMLRMTEAVAANIQAQGAYGLQTDTRMITGAIAAQLAVSGEPDAMAGLNTGARIPITLDQPGNAPANAKVGA